MTWGQAALVASGLCFGIPLGVLAEGYCWRLRAARAGRLVEILRDQLKRGKSPHQTSFTLNDINRALHLPDTEN